MIGDTPINRVFSIKDLGILFNNSFTFHDHLDYVYKREVKTQANNFWLQAHQFNYLLV